MNSVIVPGPPPPVPAPIPQFPLPPNFNGQWIGQMFGQSPGIGVLELETMSGVITGTAYHYPSEDGLVPAAIKLMCPPAVGPHQFSNLPVMAFAPDYGKVINRAEMSVLYPMSDVSETADAVLTILDNGDAFVSFQSAMASGWGTLRKAHSTPSGVQPIAMGWSQFRDWMFNWPGRDTFVFRGQSDVWPLRTSFHRTTKKNLDNYTSRFIPETYKAIVNKLKHNLDLSKREDLWCFYSTLQHHGYPTPLLDWSNSVWNAAYFAFESCKLRLDGSVRIFAFDRVGWSAMLQQEQLTMTRPHFSFIDITTRGNDRAVPQKSVFTVTNVDDIEAHIMATQQRYSRQYLWAFDITSFDRDRALADLDDMGVNRSLLFPDLDGFCRSMRIKQFGVD